MDFFLRNYPMPDTIHYADKENIFAKAFGNKKINENKLVLLLL